MLLNLFFQGRELGFKEGIAASLREVGVLRLVAKGLTDTQVAEKLVLSPRTFMRTSAPSTASWASPRAARQPAMPLSISSPKFLLAALHVQLRSHANNSMLPHIPQFD